MDGADIEAAVRPRPELPERRPALVGGERAPQQLAIHLGVEPDHDGLDEARVRLEERDGILGDLANAREEPLRIETREVLVDGHVELGRGHDAVERRDDGDPRWGLRQQATPARSEHGAESLRDRQPWIRAGDEGLTGSRKRKWDERQGRGWCAAHLATRRDHDDRLLEARDRTRILHERWQRDRQARPDGW